MGMQSRRGGRPSPADRGEMAAEKQGLRRVVLLGTIGDPRERRRAS